MGQPDVMVAQGDVRKQIRDRRKALEGGDGEGYIGLLRLLNASLEVDKIPIEIRRGSFLRNIAVLNASQRLQLLNLAERWCASDSEFRRIVKSFSDEGIERRGSGPDLSAARARLRFRRQLDETVIRDIPLIPLGAHCLAWTLPNRWGMRPPTDIARLFNPFALAAHKPRFLAKMIAEDFNGYLDPAMLIATVSHNGFEMVARKDGMALWNHCVGPYWTGSSFTRFIKAMSGFLERFQREALGPGGFRVFVIHMPNAVSDAVALQDLSRIADALGTKLASRHGVLMVDTTPREDVGLAPVAIDGLRALIRAPLPKGYKWPMSEYYNSPEGLEIELGIANRIVSIATSWVRDHG